MRYKSFNIQNYKGISNLTIDLDSEPKANVFTLVGLNESGKTTILEAISLLENHLKVREKHKLIPKAKKSNFNEKIQISAILEFTREDIEVIQKFTIKNGFRSIEALKEFKISITFAFHKSEFQTLGSGIAYEFELKGTKKNSQNAKLYNDVTPEWIVVKDFIVDNLTPTILYYPNFLFNFPTKIYLEEYDGETAEQVLYRQVVSDIIDSLGERLTLKDHVCDRMKSNGTDAKEALESVINKMGTKITKLVFTAWETLFDSKGKEIIVKEGKENVAGAEICYFELKLKEGNNVFHISERSLGFKWFFTFLLFTAFRNKRDEQKGEIFYLLDEPASNLHSTAQQKLLNTFEELLDRSRLMYTTHSHHLINPKWLSGAYIVRNKSLNYEDEMSFDAGTTDIEATLYKRFVANNPTQKTYFQPILDCLDYQPGLLEEISGIVLTEGKNDYYTFRYMNEVILEGNYSKIKFYPGNGADRNYQIISLYMAWGRDFIILMDGDKAGEAAKKNYLKEFGKAIETNIKTLKNVDANFAFATEQLFTEAERLRITQYFEPNAKVFEKGKFNTGLQNLFFEQQKIELSQHTIERFTKIFIALT